MKMKRKIKRIIFITLFVMMACQVMAQTTLPSKAWEFGVGASVLQFNRTSFSNFSQTDDGYVFDLKLDHTVYGGNLYVARELSNFFYLDLQSTLGATTNMLNNNGTGWLFMIGPGIQWRFGQFFDSKYIEPYFRAGINYMHKDFKIMYAGTEGLDDEQMKWFFNNINNKSGADKKNLMPISLGIGINMWLNDNWGIGLQGDYLVMPHKNVANSLQGTLRAMYRLGGESKTTASAIRYVDKRTTVVKEIRTLIVFEDIYFDFGKADIKPESNELLNDLAQMLKNDSHTMFLVTGYTDLRGDDEYNLELSKDRAEAVVKALVQRGVRANTLKSAGIGSKAAHVRASESDEVRAGDRKITIEPVSNRAYWNKLP